MDASKIVLIRIGGSSREIVLLLSYRQTTITHIMIKPIMDHYSKPTQTQHSMAS